MNMPDWVSRYKEWWLLLGMVILAAILTDGIYLDPGNLTDMLRSRAPIGVMAMAMTFVIITAGIDLSVGSVLALTSVATAILLVDVMPQQHGTRGVVVLPWAVLLLGWRRVH